MDHAQELEQHTAVFAEKSDLTDYKADAIQAENVEHQMTVMQAVRAYPMASFWAVVFSCLIVRDSAALAHQTNTMRTG